MELDCTKSSTENDPGGPDDRCTAPAHQAAERKTRLGCLMILSYDPIYARDEAPMRRLIVHILDSTPGLILH
jgi:hypothetical protein